MPHTNIHPFLSKLSLTDAAAPPYPAVCSVLFCISTRNAPAPTSPSVHNAATSSPSFHTLPAIHAGIEMLGRHATV